MTGWAKVMLGALGGLAAICVKYLGQDQNFAMDWWAEGDPRLEKLLFGYLILTPILMFLGGLVTWVADEKRPMRLLAMGVAAPALITTWAGGAKPTSSSQPSKIGPAGFFDLGPISTAYADTGRVYVAQSDISQSIRLFFGEGKIDQKYWVVVGSYRDKDEAAAKATSLNAQRPGLQAFVGKRQPNNDYYPVIIGEFVALPEARRLQDVARQIGLEPYLSTYADRKP